MIPSATASSVNSSFIITMQQMPVITYFLDDAELVRFSSTNRLAFEIARKTLKELGRTYSHLCSLMIFLAKVKERSKHTYQVEVYWANKDKREPISLEKYLKEASIAKKAYKYLTSSSRIRLTKFNQKIGYVLHPNLKKCQFYHYSNDGETKIHFDWQEFYGNFVYDDLREDVLIAYPKSTGSLTNRKLFEQKGSTAPSFYLQIFEEWSKHKNFFRRNLVAFFKMCFHNNHIHSRYSPEWTRSVMDENYGETYEKINKLSQNLRIIVGQHLTALEIKEWLYQYSKYFSVRIWQQHSTDEFNGALTSQLKVYLLQMKDLEIINLSQCKQLTLIPSWFSKIRSLRRLVLPNSPQLIERGIPLEILSKRMNIFIGTLHDEESDSLHPDIDEINIPIKYYLYPMDLRSNVSFEQLALNIAQGNIDTADQLVEAHRANSDIKRLKEI